MVGNNDEKIKELVLTFKSCLFDMLELTTSLTDDELDDFGVELDNVLRQAEEFIETLGSRH